MLIGSGEILRQAIKAEGISQAEFCRRIGVAQQQLNKAMHRNDFSSELIGKISDYFGVDMSYLQRESVWHRNKQTYNSK